MTSPDPARAAFEAWFASVYGPPPSDAQILASRAPTVVKEFPAAICISERAL